MAKLLASILAPVLVALAASLHALLGLGLALASMAPEAAFLSVPGAAVAGLVGAACTFGLVAERMEPNAEGLYRFIGVTVRACLIAQSLFFALFIGGAALGHGGLGFLLGLVAYLHLFPVLTAAGLEPRTRLK